MSVKDRIFPKMRGLPLIRADCISNSSKPTGALPHSGRPPRSQILLETVYGQAHQASYRQDDLAQVQAHWQSHIGDERQHQRRRDRRPCLVVDKRIIAACAVAMEIVRHQAINEPGHNQQHERRDGEHKDRQAHGEQLDHLQGGEQKMRDRMHDAVYACRPSFHQGLNVLGFEGVDVHLPIAQGVQFRISVLSRNFLARKLPSQLRRQSCLSSKLRHLIV